MSYAAPGLRAVVTHPGVAQQPVDLFDRVLRLEAHRVGEPATDRVNAERGGVEHADDPAREGQNPRRVDVVAEQIGDERVD